MQDAKTPSYAWVILAIVFLASMAGPVNQFKVPPAMQQVQEAFQISLSTAGWLMSIFSLVGMVLALPAGFMVQRMGLRLSGVFVLSCLLVGSLLGSLTLSPAVLLLSRVLEGMGMCLAGVMAPAALSVWFPPARRGTAMGLWSLWVPMGAVCMFLLVPPLAAKSWQWVWWFSSGYTAAVLLLFLLFFRLPAAYSNAQPSEQESPALMLKKIARKNIWLLAASFGCLNIAALAISSFLPLYLISVRGMEPHSASALSSLNMIFSMVTGCVAGLISDKIGSRKKLIFWPLLLMIIPVAFIFNLNPTGTGALLILLGLVWGFVPAATFTAASEMMDRPEDAGLGLAVVAFGQNLGMTMGGMFGGVTVAFGWSTASFMLAPIILIGSLAAWRIRIR